MALTRRFVDSSLELEIVSVQLCHTRCHFFTCTLRAGWSATLGAVAAEFAYRAMTTGFYGALTQAFQQARPVWKANIAVLLLLPFASHTLEICIHLARGTPKLLTNVIVSVCFTAISTLFNLYAMRRGALIVGENSSSATDDLRRVPGLVVGFLFCCPQAVYRSFKPPATSRKRMLESFVTALISKTK